ncbi:MAG: TrkH family potassium uptake protein [Candidatus Dadabacteria bacterium]|nr:TrkH family potassium uptake protein [Candidatus Dadabacteria bacterium]
MNVRFCFQITGKFVMYLGLLMLVPAVCTLFYPEDDLSAFLISALITSLAGLALMAICRIPETPTEIRRREGFLIAALCWVFASIFGAIPYYVYGVFSSPVDALFESTAGFTTTGATALASIEWLPKGILFWRNFTQWLGGMGIIVLGIAIFPRLFVGGAQLMGLETTGPTTEKFAPKIAETAKKLWIVYIALTAVLTVLLIFGGMSFFEALTHSFSTLSTGGFSCRDASIGAYDSGYIQGLITLFMFLGGTSFVLHFYFFTGRPGKLLRNSEFRFYLFFVIAATMFIALELIQTGVYGTFSESLRYASFQVVSIITTTGFTTTDFDAWPAFVKWVIFMLMFFGACAGSTSGSVKGLRIMVLFKKAHREIRRLVYPNVVSPITIEGKTINEKAVASITSFFILYILLCGFIAFVILMLEDISLESAVSAAAASITNVGPAFDEVGPANHYAHLGSPTKIILSLAMIIGRLELYTVLVLLMPSFWKR